MTMRGQYLIKLRIDMREALDNFRKFDQQWNDLNDAYSAKIKEENRRRRESGRFPHTPLGIANQKADILALKDAFAAATWWRDKAAMLANVIQAEYAIDRMMRAE